MLLEGEMEMLEVEGSFSVAEGGSMDPERKADHWSARKVLTKEEGEGTENEGQAIEVDEVIPECSPRATKRMGAKKCAKSENSKQHVSKSKAHTRRVTSEDVRESLKKP